jgi:Kef-type K+ transport system membrane component KefB
MFYAGLKSDLPRLRETGRASFLGAVGGVVLPFGFGYLLAHLFGYGNREALLVGSVLTATSVGVSAQTLMELGKLDSREGLIILSAAVIDDVLALLVLSGVLALGEGEAGVRLGVLVFRLAGFFLLAWMVGRYLPRVARWFFWLGEHETILLFVLLVMFLYSFLAQIMGGIAAITGAYLAGLFMASSEYRDLIEEKTGAFALAFFTPLFFARIGLAADARQALSLWPFALSLTLVAILSKAVGCTLGARAGQLSWAESWRFGIGMISRAEIALIIATLGLESGVFGKAVFSTCVFMALATTLVTPPLLRLAFSTRMRVESR